MHLREHESFEPAFDRSIISLQGLTFRFKEYPQDSTRNISCKEAALSSQNGFDSI
jgi:hypothetical protein